MAALRRVRVCTRKGRRRATTSLTKCSLKPSASASMLGDQKILSRLRRMKSDLVMLTVGCVVSVLQTLVREVILAARERAKRRRQPKTPPPEPSGTHSMEPISHSFQWQRSALSPSAPALPTSLPPPHTPSPPTRVRDRFRWPPRPRSEGTTSSPASSDNSQEAPSPRGTRTARTL